MLRQATWQGDYQPVTRLSVASKRHRNGTQNSWNVLNGWNQLELTSSIQEVRPGESTAQDLQELKV
jgi:hypothetical protein